jgi:uncharacterized protein YqhQ
MAWPSPCARRISASSCAPSPSTRSIAARSAGCPSCAACWACGGLGWRALTFSAEVAGGDEAEGGGKIEGPAAWATIAVTVVFAIGLFSAGPAAVAHWAGGALGLPFWASALMEGSIQIGLLIGYLWLIGHLPDIRRVFGYHGAEHKTINAFEAGAQLTPASVARFPLEHPRCGTAFLLTVALFSILLFALIGPLPLPARIASRLLLIPVVAALAFEYQRLMARHIANPIVRLLVSPSLALQRLTTREPDPAMLEVAIAAFQAMRAGEQEGAPASVS